MSTLPTNYRDITWSQIWHFRSISEKNLTGSVDTYAFGKQVYDWYSTVIKIQDSVCASISFFAWIKDLVSLRLIKKWVVRSLVSQELKHIDKTIHEISCYLFHNKKQKDPLATIAQAHQYFKSHRAEFLRPIEEEQRALGAVRLRGTPTEVEARVHRFFQEKMAQAQQGHTALPAWYYATKQQRDGLLDIITSQELREFQAAAGKGVFVSSKFETGYGHYGLAFDSQAVEKLPAQYFFTAPSAFWVQVESPIPLQRRTISHIVVDTEDSKIEVLRALKNQKALQKGDAAQLLQLPIADLDTNRIVSKCFAHTAPCTLPPDPLWTLHPWHNPYSSPPNKGMPKNCRQLFFLEYSA